MSFEDADAFAATNQLAVLRIKNTSATTPLEVVLLLSLPASVSHTRESYLSACQGAIVAHIETGNIRDPVAYRPTGSDVEYYVLASQGHSFADRHRELISTAAATGAPALATAAWAMLIGHVRADTVFLDGEFTMTLAVWEINPRFTMGRMTGPRYQVDMIEPDSPSAAEEFHLETVVPPTDVELMLLRAARELQSQLDQHAAILSGTTVDCDAAPAA